MNIFDLTPVEKIENIYVKRDDLFEYANCNGGKVRGALYIINKALQNGYTEFVSLGSRFSPQCEIISNICEQMNLKCHLFMPNSYKDTTVITNIKNNKNTVLIRDLKQGAYTNVLIARAEKFAQEHNYYFIKFGMEMPETIEILQEQVKNIPKDIKRIIVPVGSAMNFCSIINGLNKYNRNDIQVVGIQVGKDPLNVIKNYCPFFSYTKHKLIKAKPNYETQIEAYIGDLKLDPVYEAKCKEYLQDGDLFWVVGHRKF